MHKHVLAMFANSNQSTIRKTPWDGASEAEVISVHQEDIICAATE